MDPYWQWRVREAEKNAGVYDEYDEGDRPWHDEPDTLDWEER